HPPVPAPLRPGRVDPGGGARPRRGGRLRRVPAARRWGHRHLRQLCPPRRAARPQPLEGVSGMETIIAALASGAVTLAGVLIANGRSQAVTDTKLEELTREVRAHNNFAQRVPVLEEKLKVASHRLSDLERRMEQQDRKSTRLNSSHVSISYA